MEKIVLKDGDLQVGIMQCLWAYRRMQLATGKVALDSDDIRMMFPDLIGYGRVGCDWGGYSGATWPSGWDMLVLLLLDLITRHNERGNPDSGTPITINQIKEKFGSMRFYWSGGYAAKLPQEKDPKPGYHWPTLEEVEGAISFAEDYTGWIDATTGRIDDLVITSGWISFQHKDSDDIRGRKARPLGLPLRMSYTRKENLKSKG